LNDKLRGSAYILHTQKISSPENCVFRKEGREEFSRGDSKTDFGVHDMGVGVLILNLNNAYKFDLDWRPSQAYSILRGPAVICNGTGQCGNDWEHVTYPDDYYSSEKPPSFVRREKALALIKKACPGKPY
jgi:hypothetical protein